MERLYLRERYTVKNIHHSPAESLNPKFIVDAEGKKTAVVLDIKSYEAFLEKVEDLYLGILASQALVQKDELVPHEIVQKSIHKRFDRNEGIRK